MNINDQIFIKIILLFIVFVRNVKDMLVLNVNKLVIMGLFIIELLINWFFFDYFLLVYTLIVFITVINKKLIQCSFLNTYFLFFL
jgi:hypothetical protein